MNTPRRPVDAAIQRQHEAVEDAEELMMAVMVKLEAELLQHAEQVLGRVPTAQDAREHLKRNIYPNGGMMFLWDDVPILAVVVTPKEIRIVEL
jgi:hypothetical protein